MAGDEQIRARVMQSRPTVELTVAGSWQLLEPWAAGQMDYLISIKPQIITGIRLVGWCR